MNDAVAALTERYNRQAQVYRDLWAPILRVAGRRLIDALGGGRVDHVLDVGTGVGVLLPDMEEAYPGATILGVDRSPGMLRLGRTGSIRAVMDARELGVRSAGVDRVILAFMLFHLDQPVRALREARRALRPGGRVGTITWAADIESAAAGVWCDCLDDHGAPQIDPVTKTSHDQVDTPEKMTALLLSAGFASVRTWEEEFVYELDLENLIRLKSGMGSTQPRFQGLDTVAQDACVAAARLRMASLPADDFIARARILFSTAEAND